MLNNMYKRVLRLVSCSCMSTLITLVCIAKVWSFYFFLKRTGFIIVLVPGQRRIIVNNTLGDFGVYCSINKLCDNIFIIFIKML